MMKAWLLNNIGGGIGGLRLTDTVDPAPGPGEAVVRVLYAGLNPADRYLSEGQYPAKPPLPHILGRDGIGVVEQVGPGVTEFRAGDKAVILRSEIGVTRRGTFAERVAVPVESLVAPPVGWTDEQSGGAALVYLTAYQALTMWESGVPETGGVVLVTGASGGVGVACVHLAKALGHTVVALSRSATKSQKLREIGADVTLDPQDSAWAKKLKDQLAPRRVNLVVENIGGPLFARVLETLAERARVSVVGRLAGPVPEFNTSSLLFRRLRVGGVQVGAYTPAESRETWQRIVHLLDSIHARPLVDQIFPFDQLPKAFDRLAAGPMGKVLLRVS
jgi:NADPH2:quinone reductase